MPKIELPRHLNLPSIARWPWVVIEIDGMTCRACAVAIEDALRQVPGVEAAEVSYDTKQAVVGVARGAEPPRDAILAAVAQAGNYTGSFANQTHWTLAIEGMTCQGCAEGLKAALAGLPGVSGVSVSYEQGQATVAAVSSLDEEALRNAVSDTGYQVTSATLEEKGVRHAAKGE